MAYPGKIDRSWAYLLAFALCAVGAPLAQAEKVETLKAAFVLNFLKFTEYPQTASAATPPPLVIAIIGNDPLAHSFKTILDGKTAQGRRVEVHLFQTGAAWLRFNQACDALYLCQSAQSAWPDIRAALTARPLLTISEIPEFCAQGGMLNLLEQANRIRFEANPAAATKYGLKLRAELLKLATVVTTTGDTE